MAVSLIDHATWKAPAASSSGRTTTGATLIIIELASISAAGTVSDNQGNTYTALNTVTSGARNATAFYCLNPTTAGAGGHVFTSTSTSFVGAVMLAFNPTSPVFDTQNAGSSSAGTTVQPGSLTPGGATNLLICTLGGDGDTSFAINSGFTIGDTSTYVPAVAMSASLAYLEQSSATAQNPTWTVGSNAAAICSNLISFTFTGGGGPSFLARPGLAVKQAVNRAGTY